MRSDHKTLEAFSLEKEHFAVLRVELPFSSSDFVAFICERELIVLSQNSKQIGRLRLGSEGYFDQGYALSNTQPVRREKVCFWSVRRMERSMSSI